MLTLSAVLVITTLIGLVFESTCLIGLLGMALLAVLYPVPVFGCLLLAGVLWYFIFHHH